MNQIVKVVLNGKSKEVEKRAYSFVEVIELAFGSYDNTKKSYTVYTTKKNDEGEKQKKQYSYGDSIKMKEGLRINVDSTNRS